MVTESGKLICEHIHLSIVQIRIQHQQQKDTVSGDKNKEQCKVYKQMHTQIKKKKKMEFSLCLTGEFQSVISQSFIISVFFF